MMYNIHTGRGGVSYVPNKDLVILVSGLHKGLGSPVLAWWILHFHSDSFVYFSYTVEHTYANDALSKL